LEVSHGVSALGGILSLSYQGSQGFECRSVTAAAFKPSRCRAPRGAPAACL
jgi:hypothetical protein